MQGVMHLLLEAYAGERIGPRAVPEIRRLAGVKSPPLATQFYPDEVTLKLIQTVASLQAVDPGDFLYQFGIYFVTAPLMERTFRAFLEGHRSAREFVTQANSIHHLLQSSFPQASMPELRYITHESNLLEIIYDSPRHFCHFLRGILEGAAQRFHEPVEVYEMECRLRGAPACRLLVRFLPTRKSGPLPVNPVMAGTPGSGPSARSGPLPQHPSGPLPPHPPHDLFTLDPAFKRDQEEDVLVLQALSGQLSSAPRLAEPGAARPTLPLMFSLFEIAQHLTANGFSGDHARFSLIQRSLARLSAQSLVEAKLDAHTRGAGSEPDALAFGGAGVLAAQRYRITAAGQSWLREMQRKQGY